MGNRPLTVTASPSSNLSSRHSSRSCNNITRSSRGSTLFTCNSSSKRYSSNGNCKHCSNSSSSSRPYSSRPYSNSFNISRPCSSSSSNNNNSFNINRQCSSSSSKIITEDRLASLPDTIHPAINAHHHVLTEPCTTTTPTTTTKCPSATATSSSTANPS